MLHLTAKKIQMASFMQYQTIEILVSGIGNSVIIEKNRHYSFALGMNVELNRSFPVSSYISYLLENTTGRMYFLWIGLLK